MSLHIDLSEFGLDGQWVELIDVGLKSPKQFARLRTLPTDPAVVASLPLEEAAGVAREFIATVVSAWNVLDPETGTALPAPGSSDLDTSTIPLRVTKIINENIAGQFEELSPKARS